MKGIPQTSAPLAPVASWMIAIVAAWFAVAGQTWAQTLLIFAVGGLYLFFPPSGLVPRWLLILCAALLLLVGTAFLPATLLPGAFRDAFLNNKIHLPSTFSVQPWLSLEDGLLLVVTLLWAWSCLEANLSLEQRTYLAGIYVIVLGVIALNSLLRGLPAWSNLPSWVQDAGQFPNRNQTADLLAMAGIFSFARGLSAISKRDIWGTFWLGLTAVFMVAIILNDSRAGVILFGAGLLLAFWFRTRIRHHGRQLSHAILVSLVVVGGIAIFLGGKELHERFRLFFMPGGEGRIPLYKDVLVSVVSGPWCGVGLGNFEGIFNVQRIYTAGEMARSLHPDSDWMWVAFELGVPGVLILLALTVLVFRIYLRKSPFPSLTRAGMTVAIIFFVHSLFDVGGHRLGTVWNCFYLVGMGSFRTAVPSDIKIPQIALRLAGVFLIVLAGLRIQSATLNPWMPTVASLETLRVSLPQKTDLEKETLLNHGIAWAPLNWSLYYERGLLYLHAPALGGDSNLDFNRSLFLEQNSIQLPLAIGEACRNVDVTESMMVWKQLLQRSGSARTNVFNLIYAATSRMTDRMEIATLAGNDSNLQTMVAIRQDGSDFDAARQALMDQNPTLTGVEPRLIRQLFDRWVEAGDINVLVTEWPLHPEWQAAGWRAFVRGLAKAGRYGDAVTTAMKFLGPPVLPKFPPCPNLDRAARAFADNPHDPLAGVLLYSAQISAGANDDALQTLTAVVQLPKAPSYARYILAGSLTALGQDEAAWQALEPLVNTPPNSP